MISTWVLAVTLAATTGERLADIEAETLLAQKLLLPRDLAQLTRERHANFTLIMVAMSRDSQKQCDAWFEVMKDFTAIVPIELAIFPGSIRLLHGMIEGAMRKKIPLARQPLVLTHWGDADDYASAFGVTDRDEINVILVDGAAKMVWRARGEPTVQLVDALRTLTR